MQIIPPSSRAFPARCHSSTAVGISAHITVNRLGKIEFMPCRKLITPAIFGRLIDQLGRKHERFHAQALKPHDDRRRKQPTLR